MPKGWTRLLMFWSKKPELDFWKVPQRDWLRDAKRLGGSRRVNAHSSVLDYLARKAPLRLFEAN
jgi:hypothetical protein